MRFEAIGAGLIAGGSIALILALAAPGRPLPGLFLKPFDHVARARRERTSRAGSAIGATATLAGATLLLIHSSAWLWSLAAVAVVCFATWLGLSAGVRADYRQLQRDVDALQSAPQAARVFRSQAMWVGLGDEYRPEHGFENVPVSERTAEIARARIRQRATWRWALVHPLGARPDGL